MGFNSSPFNVSTMLLLAFACLVVYVRTKGYGDSNIPLFYYAVAVYYVIAYGDWTNLPPLLVYASLVLALILRFEFMNAGFRKAITTAECCALAGIMYYNLATVFGWSLKPRIIPAAIRKTAKRANRRRETSRSNSPSFAARPPPAPSGIRRRNKAPAWRLSPEWLFQCRAR